MEEILKNISAADIEKLRILLSIIPGEEPKAIVTLRVFVEEYCHLIKETRSEAYYSSVTISLKHLGNFLNQQKGMQQITRIEIENFSIYLQKKVNKGFRVYFRTLKAAFNKAIEWGYVSENFFTKVKLPKKQKLAPAFITSYDLQWISDKIKCPIVRDVVVFAFYTGMRLDEIVNLRWKNVDFANGVITVGDEEFITKGRTQRFIPMSDEALTSVLSQRERKKLTGVIVLIGSARDFVFCKMNGEKYSGDYFSQSFKRACKAAGMSKEIHFHSLRHSFASNLVQKGVPLYTIKELLGHSSISTTEIYSHLNMDSLKEAISKFDASTSSSSSSELRLGADSRITKNEVKEKSIKGHTISFPHSRGESNDVKIFRINDGEL